MQEPMKSKLNLIQPPKSSSDKKMIKSIIIKIMEGVLLTIGVDLKIAEGNLMNKK